MSCENVAVRVLCADTHPDHDTICAFRGDNAGLSALLAIDSTQEQPVREATAAHHGIAALGTPASTQSPTGC